MDKCYRVVYKNKAGETLLGMWKDKMGAETELLAFRWQKKPHASVYNDLDLTVDVLYNVTHAEVEELYIPNAEIDKL